MNTFAATHSHTLYYSMYKTPISHSVQYANRDRSFKLMVMPTMLMMDMSILSQRPFRGCGGHSSS